MESDTKIHRSTSFSVNPGAPIGNSYSITDISSISNGPSSLTPSATQLDLKSTSLTTSSPTVPGSHIGGRAPDATIRRNKAVRPSIAQPLRLFEDKELRKYLLLDELGKGAFGTVFRGLDHRTRHVVAIKQLKKSNIVKGDLASVIIELETLQTLEHPNIVKFIEFEETTQYLYYVMEFIEGGSLYSLLKKFKAFPEKLVLIYMSQVLLGLQYLHEKGIVHRDIKGANILLNKEGICKLADFGSCTGQSLNQSDSIVGTPFWMAPEVVDGGGATPAADIWSVACTIIELLTGFPPYWSLGSHVAMYRMVQDEHPPLPNVEISMGLTSFIRQCFIRKVELRPSADVLLKHPWIKEFKDAKVQEQLADPSAIKKKNHSTDDLRIKTPSRIGRLGSDTISSGSMTTRGQRRSTVVEKKEKPLFFQKIDREEKIKEVNEKKEGLYIELQSLTERFAIEKEEHKQMISVRKELERIRFQLSEKKKEIITISNKVLKTSTTNKKRLLTLSVRNLMRDITELQQEQSNQRIINELVDWIQPGRRCRAMNLEKGGEWGEAVISKLKIDGFIRVIFIRDGTTIDLPASALKPAPNNRWYV